jgi:hypothetical protein
MPINATSRTGISISGLAVEALTMVLVTCPYCGVNVRTDRLTAHVARRCRSAAEIRLIVRSVHVIIIPPRGRTSRRRPVRHAPRVEPYDETRPEGALDKTRDYAHPFREDGKWGSHSLHDDYGEESFPQFGGTTGSPRSIGYQHWVSERLYDPVRSSQAAVGCYHCRFKFFMTSLESYPTKERAPCLYPA